MSNPQNHAKQGIFISLSPDEVAVISEALKYAELEKKNGSAPRTVTEQNVAIIEKLQKKLSAAAQAAKG